MQFLPPRDLPNSGHGVGVQPFGSHCAGRGSKAIAANDFDCKTLSDIAVFKPSRVILDSTGFVPRDCDLAHVIAVRQATLW